MVYYLDECNMHFRNVDNYIPNQTVSQWEIVGFRGGWTEFFGILGVMWFHTDVSGLPIGPIFKTQVVPHPLRWDDR